MKKRFAVVTIVSIIISALGFSSSAFATVGEPISGVPIGLEGDPGSIMGGPISGVPIGLEHDPGSDTGQIAVTDDKGQFTFTNLAAGNYKLQIMQKEGAAGATQTYWDSWGNDGNRVAESTKAIITTTPESTDSPTSALEGRYVFVGVTIKLLAKVNSQSVKPYILTIGPAGGTISGTVNVGRTGTITNDDTDVSGAVGTAGTSSADFSDVPATYWAYNFIAALKAHGITSGYGNGKFGPERSITKAETVKMALIAAGIKTVTTDVAPYDDVPLSNSLAIYVATAKSLGFLPNDKIFSPNQPASRFFTLKLLIDMLGKHDEAVATTGAPAFSDTTTDEQNQYTTYAKSKGIIQGYGNGKYGPADNVQRDQMAKIIYNSLEILLRFQWQLAL